MIILTSCFTMDKTLEWVTSQNGWEEIGLLPLPIGLFILEMPHPWDLLNTFIFLSEASQVARFNSDFKCCEKKI
jgi:hypothetical protein